MKFNEPIIPPMPLDMQEATRWNHTRMRRRMLDGLWEQDLKTRLAQHLGTTRKEAYGAIDMSSNYFLDICTQLAVLYLKPPKVFHPDESANDLIGARGILHKAGLWPDMRRFQIWVLGCREYLMRIHVDPEKGTSFRPVPPDMVHCKSDPDDPSRPIAIAELRQREDPSGKLIWTWDVLDISDSYNPTYKVLSNQGFYQDKAVDLTEQYLGRDMSGFNYPYTDSGGRPFLPYVVYHAERMGDRMWDCTEWREILEGSLNLSVGYTMWYAVLRQASWPQRWLANARISGMDLSPGESPRTEVITAPSTVLCLDSKEDGVPVQVGQWNPGADIEKMHRSLMDAGSRMAMQAGLNPSDIQRQTGNARSGFAIALSQSGRREQRLRFMPGAQRADEELITKTAMMNNRVMGTSYPETGYEVTYAEIELSSQEKEARRRDVFERLDRGFISPAQAKSELSGLSISQSARELKRARALAAGLE